MIISCIRTAEENRTFYTDSPIPCVTLGSSLENSKVSSVQVNSFAVSQKIAKHLVDEGYTNFMYFGPEILSKEKDIRFTAFQNGLEQSGFSLDSDCVFYIPMNPDTESRVIHRALETYSSPIGVFCHNDLIATRVYRSCYSIGKRVPKDVGIVGFDDLSVASQLSLSTGRYRISTMADMALTLLINKINIPDAPYDHMSGMEGISPEIYESATIDGVGVFIKFKAITFPHRDGRFSGRRHCQNADDGGSWAHELR